MAGKLGSGLAPPRSDIISAKSGLSSTQKNAILGQFYCMPWSGIVAQSYYGSKHLYGRSLDFVYLNQSCKPILQILSDTFPLVMGKKWGKKNPNWARTRQGVSFPQRAPPVIGIVHCSGQPPWSLTQQCRQHASGKVSREMWMAACNQGKWFNPRCILICSGLPALPEPDPMFLALQEYCLMGRG